MKAREGAGQEGRKPAWAARSGPGHQSGVVGAHEAHVEVRTLCWAQKAPAENEISVSDATKGNRENQLLPIFRPHSPFPGVCLANTAL